MRGPKRMLCLQGLRTSVCGFMAMQRRKVVRKRKGSRGGGSHSILIFCLWNDDALTEGIDKAMIGSYICRIFLLKKNRDKHVMLPLLIGANY